MIILHVAVPTPLHQLFSYKADTLVPIGCRVNIPFGKQSLVGVVVSHASSSNYPFDKLKSIIEILDDTPILPDHLLLLCQWASEYYHYSLGEIINTALPTALRQGNKSKEKKWKEHFQQKFLKSTAKTISQPATLILNTEQKNTLKIIYEQQSKFNVFLLYGITGSGKTEIYLQLIQEALKKQQQALVLIPEISLTPQTIERFQQRFGDQVIAVHSKLSPKDRLYAFWAAQNQQINIIIGTRSAIFTPFKNLGLIIVDEEHDISYKQQEGFRYSARDLAIRRAQIDNIPILLGSATPSLESLLNVEKNRYQLLTLLTRAGAAVLPNYQIIDLRNKKLEHGLSQPLIEKIREHINKKNQVLLFLNRRGFSPTILCHHCGWIADCNNCHAHLVLHKSTQKLHCHHCGKMEKSPRICPQCQQQEIQPIGAGTERIEETLKQYFPHEKISRIDRDSTQKKNSLKDMLEIIHQNDTHILIGTQMLAKGHHFPHVTMVGIIDADGGIFSADFRGLERMSQLILQVAGRAGRADKAGEVIIQTHHPEHPLFSSLIHHGYLDFAKSLLTERQTCHLPPFIHFALLHAESKKEKIAEKFLEQIKKTIAHNRSKILEVMGPFPALMQKRAGYYRMQLLIQSEHRAALHKALYQLTQYVHTTLKPARSIRWSLDVDPQEMF